MYVKILKNLNITEAFLKISKLSNPAIRLKSDINTDTGLTYIFAEPFLEVETIGQITTVKSKDFNETFDDPFQALEEAINHIKTIIPKEAHHIPKAFGYLSYDLKKHTIDKCKDMKADSQIPLMKFSFYSTYIAYLKEYNQMLLTSADENKYKDVIEAFEKALSEDLNINETTEGKFISSDMTKDEYMDAVNMAKTYIEEGDIYQINISQKIKFSYKGNPYLLFTKLIKENPMTYPMMVGYEDFQVFTNSPERFVKINGQQIETRPIKGTRKRSSDEKQDLKLIEELKNSKKEKAEHVMIVDLERNDLGRVCKAGTITVEDFEKIKTYPTLHHMESIVKGTLKKDVSPIKALKELFPGGSITGTPKIRAIEIIDELEREKRGVYTGAIGTISLSGHIDMAMAIRTALIKEGEIKIGIGSGIVIDSDAEDEYEETLLKAKNIMSAMNINLTDMEEKT